jgi:hypothetical protein
MQILLDECLPRRLARELPGHEVRTVPAVGWEGTPDGDLLQLAAGTFDVFITADRGVAYQQNIAGFDIAVVVLRGRTNRLADVSPLMPAVLALLPTIRPGEIATVDG